MRINRPKQSGVTLIELLVTVAVMAIITAVLVPMFTGLRNSWDVSIGDSDITQNARVLFEHLDRHLAQAKQVKSISNPDDPRGYLTFRDPNGISYRYEWVTGNTVHFGPESTLAELAGSVESCWVRAYRLEDLSRPITDVNQIRVIELEVLFSNTSERGRSRTWQTTVLLRPALPVQTGLDRGLVGHWTLDEGEGDYAYDSSGWGNHGYLVDMTGDEWTTGLLAGALTFGGGPQRAKVPSQIGGDFTLAAWLQTDQIAYGGSHWASGYGLMDAEVAGGGDDYGCGVVDGRFVFGVGSQGQGDRSVGSTSYVNNGVWHHVAACFDAVSGFMHVYVDGHLEASANGWPGVKDANPWMTVGNTSDIDLVDPRGAFEGILDDLRLYERILSPAEIKQLSDQLGEQSIHLPLDEGHGLVAGDVLNHYDGRLCHMDVAAWVTGRMGYGLMFDGLNDYVEIPRTVSEDLSLVLWMKSTATGGGSQHAPWTDGLGLIDGDQPGDGDDFGLSLIQNHIAFGVGAGLMGETTLHGSQPVNDDVWHHIAATRSGDDGTMILYLDGTEISRTIGPTGPKTHAPTLRIGSRWPQTVGGFYSGLLDEIQVYDRLVSPDEVAALAAVSP